MNRDGAAAVVVFLIPASLTNPHYGSLLKWLALWQREMSIELCTRSRTEGVVPR